MCHAFCFSVVIFLNAETTNKRYTAYCSFHSMPHSTHKKQNVPPFLVSAKKIISPSPKIPPRTKPAPSPHNPKTCPDVKKDLLPFRSIIFHQERSKLFSSKNNAANYSFVSCSHFLITKRCANFQTHKLLLQSFRIECFSSFSYWKIYFARR